MQFLIHTIGSHGDVLPFIRLGAALQRRGHDVHFFLHRIYTDLARDAGLPVTSIDEPAKQEVIFNDPDLLHQVRAHRVLARIVAATTPCAYEAMREKIGPGPTVIIGSSVAFACRLLQETHDIPCITVHLAPAVLRSTRQPTRLSSLRIKPPAQSLQLAWWLIDRCFSDPLFARPLNRLRATLKLQPVRRVIDRWLHEADMVLGLFPDWFAPAPVDWPENLRLTGFPLPSRFDVPPLPANVEAFLRAGPAPIGFTPGTYTASAREYFETSAAACRMLDCRAIFLTRFRDQLPPSLPENIAHFDYVSFEALLPRLAMLVHHGGIGTMSQALRAAIPQLIRPTSYDQFDNSARIDELGIGAELLPHEYTPTNLAATLARMMDNDGTRATRLDIQQRMTAVDGIEAACDAVLRAPFCRRSIRDGRTAGAALSKPRTAPSI